MKGGAYLKKVIAYCLAMSTAVTLGALAIGWRACQLPSGTVTALCGLWSIELALGAWIKNAGGRVRERNESPSGRDAGGTI